TRRIFSATEVGPAVSGATPDFSGGTGNLAPPLAMSADAAASTPCGKHSACEITVGITQSELTVLSAALVAIKKSNFFAWVADCSSGLAAMTWAMEAS